MGTSQHFLALSVLVIIDPVTLSIFAKLHAGTLCDTSPTFFLPSSAPPFSSLTGFLGLCSALLSSHFAHLLCHLVHIHGFSYQLSSGSNKYLLSGFVSWAPDCRIQVLRAHLHAGDSKAPNGLTYHHHVSGHSSKDPPSLPSPNQSPGPVHLAS